MDRAKRMQAEIDVVRLLDTQAKIEIRGHRLRLEGASYFCISCGYNAGTFHHGSLKGALAHIRENGLNCNQPWVLESRIEQIKALYSDSSSLGDAEQAEPTLSEIAEELGQLHAKIDRLLRHFGIRHAG